MPSSVKRENVIFTRHGIEDCLVSAGVKITAITAQGGHFCVRDSTNQHSPLGWDVCAGKSVH